MSKTEKPDTEGLKKAAPGGADRNVWSDPVEPAEFELVSTLMLQKILKSDDEDRKQKIEDAAARDAGADGVLARDVGTDSYRIVDSDGSEEFSLVSTQMLQKMLNKDAPEKVDEEEITAVESGFDPYNSS